jgi:hypothetical protein
VPAFQEYKGNVASFIDNTVAQNGNVNFLTMTFAQNKISGNIGAALRPFLLTTPTGGGWLGGGKQGYRSISEIPNHEVFFPGRFVSGSGDAVWHNFSTGEEILDDHTRIPQFQRFQTFMGLFGNRKRLTFEKSTNVPKILMALLRTAEESEQSISEMVYHIDLTTRQLGLLNFCRPESPVKAASREDVTARELPLKSFCTMGFIRLINWKAMIVPRFDESLLKFAYAMMEDFEQFAIIWFHVKDHLPGVQYTRTRRMELVLGLAPDTTGMIARMGKVVVNSHLSNLKIQRHSNIYFAKKLELGMNFVNDMKGWYGFSDRIFFDPAPDEIKDLYSERKYQKRRLQPMMSLTVPELEKALRNNDLVDMIRRVKESNGILEIIAHVKVQRQEVVDIFTQEVPFTYGYADSNKPLTVGTISKYVTPADTFFLKQSNDLAFFRKPEWFPDEHEDMMEIRLERLMDLFHHRTVSLRDEFSRAPEIEIFNNF